MVSVMDILPVAVALAAVVGGWVYYSSSSTSPGEIRLSGEDCEFELINSRKPQGPEVDRIPGIPP
jgi:cytochrome-b5 reductase